MAFNQAILVLATIGFIVLFIVIASWCACRRFPTTQPNSERHIPLTVNRRHNPEQRAYLRQVREQNVLHVSEEIHAATTVNVVNDGRRRHADGTSLCGEYPDEDYEEEEQDIGDAQVGSRSFLLLIPLLPPFPFLLILLLTHSLIHSLFGLLLTL
jgi:hypothetical protein